MNTRGDTNPNNIGLAAHNRGCHDHFRILMIISKHGVDPPNWKFVDTLTMFRVIEGKNMPASLLTSDCPINFVKSSHHEPILIRLCNGCSLFIVSYLIITCTSLIPRDIVSRVPFKPPLPVLHSQAAVPFRLFLNNYLLGLNCPLHHNP